MLVIRLKKVIAVSQQGRVKFTLKSNVCFRANKIVSNIFNRTLVFYSLSLTHDCNLIQQTPNPRYCTAQLDTCWAKAKLAWNKITLRHIVWDCLKRRQIKNYAIEHSSCFVASSYLSLKTAQRLSRHYEKFRWGGVWRLCITQWVSIKWNSTPRSFPILNCNLTILVQNLCLL